jgi:CheY-like chemotaxis protein
MMAMKVLLIDDQRTPVLIKSQYDIQVTSVATDYNEGIRALKEDGPFDLLLLDHDLGSYNEDGREMTGTDIMQFLLENPIYLPIDIYVVSANPVGAQRMREMAKRAYDQKRKG